MAENPDIVVLMPGGGGKYVYTSSRREAFVNALSKAGESLGLQIVVQGFGRNDTSRAEGKLLKPKCGFISLTKILDYNNFLVPLINKIGLPVALLMKKV